MPPQTGTRNFTKRERDTEDDRPGKQYVVAIGIDHYRDSALFTLHNAVQDAVGVDAAFRKLGFESLCKPILEKDATRERLHHLVHSEQEIRGLQSNDSLVVFFAGHGCVDRPGPSTRVGCLMPVDAKQNAPETWLGASNWLKDLALTSPRHIFVIIDACHSGITLDAITRYRGDHPKRLETIEGLKRRRSRRIITSALDDQLASDNGPIAGHSLFTGCLIQALDGGVFARECRPFATTSEVCSLVRSDVINYPDSKQTPDCGALESHDHGELVVEMRIPDVQPGSAMLFSRIAPHAAKRPTTPLGAAGVGPKQPPAPTGHDLPPSSKRR